MAHLVRHLPPKWELVRGESLTDKKNRKVLREKREEAEKYRASTTGMWWEDQRYVDQVVPAHFVHPDLFDTFNYRYQVYARPLVKAPPRCLAEACDNPVPVTYNVKRMAVDKVWVPGNSSCEHHYLKQHWELSCCPPIRREPTKDCSQNNNTSFADLPPSVDIFVIIHPRQHQMVVFSKDTGQCMLSDVDSDNSNFLHYQGFGQASTPDTSGDPISSSKQEYICTNEEAYSRNYDVVNSKYKDLHCDNLNCNVAIENRPTEDRTGSASSQSETAACSLALASANKDWMIRGVVSSVSCQTNNRNGDLTNESHGMVVLDNLEGIYSKYISNCSVTPNTAFVMRQDSHNTPEMYLQDGVTTRWPRKDRFCYNNSLCRNNNAGCGSASEERPACVPRQYCDCCCYTPSPCQLNTSHKSFLKRDIIKTTSCMEMLGHLESRVKPPCFRDLTPKPGDARISEVAIETAYEKKMKDVGYRTYKIIGGKQYRLPPPSDYMAGVKFPRHLEEYREFTRRCPNPQVGRYDRSDPANEMFLPGNIDSRIIKVHRNPFIYMRNPKRNQFPPLFYTPIETGELVWCLPGAA